jgi:hypothetical protein
MNIAKLEQLIYEVELFSTDTTDSKILDKLRHITDLFGLVVMELQADYYLQQSIQEMGDKRKKE